MDYSFFDGLIDSVFVVDAERQIIYCNEAAAKLCDSSVRRLAKGRPIYEIITFSDQSLFVMPSGEAGRDTPSPYTEIKFQLKAGKEGKVQIAIQPFSDSSGERRWVVMLRDVTLEEVLHAKYHKQLEEKEVYIEQLQKARLELENYSKNLEKMVEERTQEVRRANRMLNAIMESLGQGFLVFDMGGVCSDIYTKACLDILETDPAAKKIWDVLKVPSHEIETFKMWLEATFTEQLPFENLKDLGPTNFDHSQQKHITLDYFPLRGEKNEVLNMVLVATDKTTEYLANIALEKEKKFANMIVKMITSRKQFVQFLDSAKELTAQLKKNVMAEEKIDHAKIFRGLHTLEGEAATFSITELWQSSRDAQEIIEPLKRGETCDVRALKIKLLAKIDMITESYSSFVNKNAELLKTIGIGHAKDAKIEISKNDMDQVVRIIDQSQMPGNVRDKIRDLLLKEPLGVMIEPYGDLVKTVANKLGKKVNPMTFKGTEIKLFLEPYNNLFSAMVHAFRNAVDHGIETPEQRVSVGKMESGTIEFVAQKIPKSHGWIRMMIRDDGGGISLEKMKEKLRKGELGQNTDKLSYEELIQHVFDAGISTKEEVGEFSGRGVGLDAVRTEAEALGGKVWVESTEGAGTKLFIEVPEISELALNERAS